MRKRQLFVKTMQKCNRNTEVSEAPTPAILLPVTATSIFFTENTHRSPNDQTTNDKANKTIKSIQLLFWIFTKNVYAYISIRENSNER